MRKKGGKYTSKDEWVSRLGLSGVLGRNYPERVGAFVCKLKLIINLIQPGEKNDNSSCDFTSSQSFFQTFGPR